MRPGGGQLGGDGGVGGREVEVGCPLVLDAPTGVTQVGPDTGTLSEPLGQVAARVLRKESHPGLIGARWVERGVIIRRGQGEAGGHGSEGVSFVERAGNRPRGVVAVAVLADGTLAHFPRPRRRFPDGVRVGEG